MTRFILAPNKAEVAERISGLRARAGWTQVEAAEKIQAAGYPVHIPIHRATFAMWETGSAPLRERDFIAVARAFDVMPEWLAWGDMVDVVAGYVVVARKAEPHESELADEAEA